MEISDLLHLRGQLLEDLPGIGALQGEGSEIVRYVFDLNRHTAGEVLQIGHVGLGSSEQELVVAVTEDDSVFDHPPVVVTPDRVMSLSGSAFADVACQNAGEESLGV